MTTKVTPPLFERYTVEQLTELTPYSEAYLLDLYRRPSRIRPHFRRTVAAVLGLPEAELFAEHPTNGNGGAIGEHPDNGGAS